MTPVSNVIFIPDLGIDSNKDFDFILEKKKQMKKQEVLEFSFFTSDKEFTKAVLEYVFDLFYKAQLSIVKAYKVKGNIIFLELSADSFQWNCPEVLELIDEFSITKFPRSMYEKEIRRHRKAVK